jgi:very-long-chain (3R)-3-hydroxyacyl-CoA dehydratase
MYRAAGVTSSSLVAGIFYFCLGLYAPGEWTYCYVFVMIVISDPADKSGSIMMYSYMLKQRRKTLAK